MPVFFHPLLLIPFPPSEYWVQCPVAKEPLPRLDNSADLRKDLLPLCRLQPGEIWNDPAGRHRIGCLDATSRRDTQQLFGGRRADIMINDPPYNISVGGRTTQALSHTPVDRYLSFSADWIENVLPLMKKDSHFYVWMGADQKKGFQPLADFMLLMRNYPQLESRSFITLRNQRGYGTQHNWMAVRQELLYYTRGKPDFRVSYTDIPKILKGYYKTVNGRRTENMERSRSRTLRPGNVWLDIQQVFYRMEENVPGMFAQKPLKAIERILHSAGGISLAGDLFAHSGTTLIAAEKMGISCFTADIDPLFCELTIRRLENYRATGMSGWQCRNPFPEIE